MSDVCFNDKKWIKVRFCSETWENNYDILPETFGNDQQYYSAPLEDEIKCQMFAFIIGN